MLVYMLLQLVQCSLLFCRQQLEQLHRITRVLQFGAVAAQQAFMLTAVFGRCTASAGSDAVSRI
jgi:hypothetical protein